MGFINCTLTILTSLAFGALGWHATNYYYLHLKKTNVSFTQTTNFKDLEMINLDQVGERDFKNLFNNL
jgi:hypothetical protein